MSKMKLTKSRLQGAVWEGLLWADDAEPVVEVMYMQRPIKDMQLQPTQTAGEYALRISLPHQMMSDGVHTALITDGAAGNILERITVMAGDALAEDIRAEMDLLRAELDLLKQAFRRHCVETQ